MPARVLELNDCALLLGDGIAPPWRSPGYAIVTRDAVITGAAALARARIEPRHTLNQFWLRLGTEALHDARAHARHQADLAWSQLEQLATQAGGEQRVILAVPGSFSREQLGILLGIAQRTPFRAIGLVDSALAGATTTTIASEALHLDLQLHQCVLTRIVREGDEIVRQSVRTLPGCGLVQLQESWAQLLAGQFIQQSRFDPMHAASTEQQLYDHLPRWLDMLQRTDDVAVTLTSGGTGYHAKLRASDVLEAAQPVYSQIADAVRRDRDGADVLASTRFASLARIDALLPTITRLEETAVIHGCLKHAALICSEEPTLRFVTRLPANADMAPAVDTRSADAGGTSGDSHHATRPATSMVPSHLVVGARAVRLEPGSLYLYRNLAGWALSRQVPETFAGTLTWDGAGWLLIPARENGLRLDGQPVQTPQLLCAGQQLQPEAGADTLRLVAESPVGDDGT